jgi:hypothetical protein
MACASIHNGSPLSPWLDTVFRQATAVGQAKRQRYLLANGRYAKDWGNQSAERVARDRVRYALTWRATFLATYAVSASKTASCTAAKVSTQTVDKHYAEDRDFALQVDQARAHAIDLLPHPRHAASARGRPGEPVYWQGVKVDHVRKFSDRLQIEMLRAHLPHTFKTPGLHGVPVTVNTGDQILVMDEETRAKIIEARRRALTKRLAANSESPENVVDVTPLAPSESTN